MRTSKLTKDEPKATVVYPDDVEGPVTVKVTGGEELFTKKITFAGDGNGGDDGGDDGGGDQQPTGDIEATVEQDQANPRKVTVTVTAVPSDGGSGDDSGEEGEPSNGPAGSEGGTQGTGRSTADQTKPKARAGDDSGSGDGESGSETLTIDWGGKTKGEAPAEITKDEPVTVEYDKSVERATITIDDDDPDTEPFTKGLKFGAPPEPDGDIVVEATQDESNPRKVTFELTKAPTGGDSGEDGSEGGDDSSGSGELNIDYGAQVNSDAPETIKLGEPITVTYAASVEKATVTVDDDDPDTEAWTKQIKFGAPGQEEIKAEVTQDQEDPRRVTLKVTEFPPNAEKLTVDWGGAATVDQDNGGGSGDEQDGGQE